MKNTHKSELCLWVPSTHSSLHGAHKGRILGQSDSNIFSISFSTPSALRSHHTFFSPLWQLNVLVSLQGMSLYLNSLSNMARGKKTYFLVACQKVQAWRSKSKHVMSKVGKEGEPMHGSTLPRAACPASQNNLQKGCGNYCTTELEKKELLLIRKDGWIG